MKEKRLLLIVDFQNAFISSDLGENEVDTLESLIDKRIMEYYHNDYDIAFTIDLVKQGSNNEIYGIIKNHLDKACAKFYKNTYGSLEFGIWLTSTDYKKIEICGLVSNMCVLSNAIIAKSALPNAEIMIDSKITASVNDDLGRMSLEIMKGLKMTVL